VAPAEAVARQKERINILEREQRLLMRERDANEERFKRIRKLHT
jgi:uncharacterized protein YigA (DUF484 family)